MTADLADALAVVGLTPVQAQVYRAVLRCPAVTEEALADRTGRPPDEVADALAGLVARGLVEVEAGACTGRPPAEAVGRLLTTELERWRSFGDRLGELRDRVLPTLQAEHLSASVPGGQPVPVEVVEGPGLAALLRSLAHGSRGELLWMRRDDWTGAEGDAVDASVREAVDAGRRSRVLFPARILEEAPDVLWRSAQAGEQVRILAEVPCRLAVLGDQAAVLSEEHGAPTGRLLVVRHPSLVAALRLVVDTLWEKAMAVPGLDAHQRHRDELARGLLLDLLADGAKDEQISRELGVSLRTVRRRVAELLDDLGAGSRFQAGVEAVRRGWV